MAIFNTSSDYFGQDIHIWRNGKTFPLYKLFDSSKNLDYRFLIPLVSNQYENITIIPGNDLGIKVDSYTSSAPKVTNFFIHIREVSTTEWISILVHIHDNLSNIWLSPNNITFRTGMIAKYGIIANFSDGIYADFSYYPEISYELDSTLQGIFEGGETITKANPDTNYPTNPPKEYENKVTVKIPPYLLGGTVPATLSGSIKILDDYGNLKLHSGNIKEIDKRINILCLSDGFNNSSNANRSTFRKIVRQYQKQLIKNTSYSPWNLFKDKVNIWSYYMDGLDNVSTLDEPHIIINNNDCAFELQYFIEIFDLLVSVLIDQQYHGISITDMVKLFEDQYGNDFINFIGIKNQPFYTANPTTTLPVSALVTSAKFVFMDYLCAKVGFPTMADLNTNIGTMRDKWRDEFKWITADFKISSDSGTLQNTDYFLNDYIFDVWKKLDKRIYLEKRDTAFGIKNIRLYRDDAGRFTTPSSYFFGSSKFPSASYNNNNIVHFGKFINKIRGNNQHTQNLGKIFYNDDGYPQPSNSGNIELDKIVGPANNIIILSRITRTSLRGVNVPYFYNNYSSRISYVSLHSGNSDKGIICDISNNQYSQASLEFSFEDNEIRNTIAHEFSHNYLKDEYSGRQGDIYGKPDANDIKTDLEISNLTTSLDLETSAGVNNINGQNIKWQWPRISKIGMATDSLVPVQGSSGIYQCTLRTNGRNARNIKDSFQLNDRVLLRKRFLFTTDYIACNVESIVSRSKNIQVINIKPDSPINESDYGNDFIILLPFWTPSLPSTPYQKLVHHEIRDAITNTGVNGSPMLDTDSLPLVLNKPQEIMASFRSANLSIINKFTNTNIKSNIVGLYAGGRNSYVKGIYHGTGFCMMRGSKDNIPNSFCPVCSYMLIDYIDPMQHPYADSNYGEYPL